MIYSDRVPKWKEERQNEDSVTQHNTLSGEWESSENCCVCVCVWPRFRHKNMVDVFDQSPFACNPYFVNGGNYERLNVRQREQEREREDEIPPTQTSEWQI